MLLLRSSQKEGLLKQEPLFNNFSKCDLEEIGKHTEPLRVETGKVLAEQGKTGWEFIYIVEGKVSKLSAT